MLKPRLNSYPVPYGSAATSSRRSAVARGWVTKEWWPAASSR